MKERNIEKSINQKIKEIGKYGLVYSLGTFSQSLVGFLLLPMYANFLSPYDYGVFALIQFIGTVLGTFFYFGASSALPRSYFSYKNKSERIKVFNVTFTILFIGALIQIFIGFVFSEFFSVLLTGEHIFSSLISIQICSSAIAFLNTGFYMYLRLVRNSKVIILLGILNISIIVALVYFFLVLFSLGLKAPIFAIFISNFITICIFVFYFRNTISLVNTFSEEYQIQLKYGLPIAIASISQMVLEWGDRLVLNELLDISSVGIYSFAVRLAMVFNVLIITPFSMIWEPVIMDYKSDKNIRDLFTKITNYFSIIASIFITGCYFFLGELLSLLIRNNSFNDSIKLVPLVMIGIFFFGLNSIFSAGIKYARKTDLLIYIYIFWGFINICLNILFIPIYGLLAPVMLAIFCKLSISITILFLSRKYFSFTIEIYSLGKLLLIILNTFLLKYIFEVFFDFNILLVKVNLYVLFLFSIYFYIFSDKEKKIQISSL